MSTKESIKKFILEELISDKQLSDVENTDSLLESGLIDSINIAELII
jgi:acyl carrier protein